MNAMGWLQIAIFAALLIVTVKPLGVYMARVYQGQTTPLSAAFAPVERFIYRRAGVNETHDMSWKEYSLAVIAFSAISVVALYGLLRLQGVLPFNPLGYPAIEPGLAFNTAVSFVTNTNWQAFGGEASLSLLAQMLGLAVQNFLSAAAGMAIFAAVSRGFARAEVNTLGNFWVDLTRGVLYILLPLSVLAALALAACGSVQTLSAQLPFHTLDGAAESLAVGPVASQVAIKHVGTNGGGFFNANAAHPFENPSPLSNLILMLAETVIPAGLVYTFGVMVGDRRQGWSLLLAMLLLLLPAIAALYTAEAQPNAALAGLSGVAPAGNLEGKETRFGVANSALFAAITTATSSGAVNSMHDSFSPLGGLVPLVLMQLGEVVLGGVGSGMYGMLVFVVIAVFVAGLMVGRTPEYLGKKIEPFEMKMAAICILIMPILVLGGAAAALMLPEARAAITNPGAHGLSQVLYAFTSMGNNNGSAFAGLGANQAFFNIAGGVVMFIARFWTAVPVLALAASFAAKKKIPVSAGTLSTTSPMFIGWLLLVVILVGALNFFPALALGPIIEHLQQAGI